MTKAELIKAINHMPDNTIICITDTENPKSYYDIGIATSYDDDDYNSIDIILANAYIND